MIGLYFFLLDARVSVQVVQFLKGTPVMSCSRRNDNDDNYSSSFRHLIVLLAIFTLLHWPIGGRRSITTKNSKKIRVHNH